MTSLLCFQKIHNFVHVRNQELTRTYTMYYCVLVIIAPSADIRLTEELVIRVTDFKKGWRRARIKEERLSIIQIVTVHLSNLS